MQVQNRSRRLILSSPEALEVRCLLNAGVGSLPKAAPLADLQHKTAAVTEVREYRYKLHQAHELHHGNRPHFHAPVTKNHAHDSSHDKDKNTKHVHKGEASPGVEPLKANRFINRWRRSRLGRNAGHGGTGTGSGSGTGSGTGSSGGGTTGTPAPTVATQTMTPAMIRHAYGFDQLNLTGAGQTIAIVDAYDSPTIANDLAVFSQKYGLPQANFVKSVPSTGTPAYNAGWAYEIALDVEWAHAIAPGAKILLVEAASASYSDLLAAVDSAVAQGANQVSMSWGGGETPTDLINNAHFNHPGVTFTASSGDSGAGTLGPASSPYVVAVGGTTLSTDAAGNRLSETAWSGSGGGVSTYQSKPSYQNGFTSTTHRSSPDVSYDANPTTGFSVYNSSGGRGWAVVGGTSAGAPQWAALFALVNQGRAQAGKAPIGTGLQYGTNSALYSLAGGSSYTNPIGAYMDVSVGSNGYAAGPGYDTVTGLGSPNANKLVPALINS